MVPSPMPRCFAAAIIFFCASSVGRPLNSPDSTVTPYSVNGIGCSIENSSDEAEAARAVPELRFRARRSISASTSPPCGDIAPGQRMTTGGSAGRTCGELVVALVVRRHRHDGAGAVVAQHEVGHPHRHRFVRERVDGREAGVDALLLELAADPRRPILRAERLHLLLQRRDRRRAGQRLARAGARAEHDERGAVDGVDAGREDLDLRRRIAFERKRDAGALGAPDPVPLHREHLLGPLVETVVASSSSSA
jgi:hypothetical protein